MPMQLSTRLLTFRPDPPIGPALSLSSNYQSERFQIALKTLVLAD